MQALGNALLAGAGLAADEHAVFAVGKGVRVIEQAQHAIGNRNDVIRTLGLAVRTLQPLQNARQHCAQFRSGEIERQHMRILGCIAARGGTAQVGADPQYRHAAKRAFDMVAAEARAFERIVRESTGG